MRREGVFRLILAGNGLSEKRMPSQRFLFERPITNLILNIFMAFCARAAYGAVVDSANRVCQGLNGLVDISFLKTKKPCFEAGRVDRTQV